MEFSRQEYWGGLPFPPPGDLPHPGIKPRSPALQSFVLEPAGKLLAPFISKSPKFVPTTFYSLGKSLCGITIGNVRDVDLIPGSGRSPGGGRGHWPQYACLENAMDRGAWWATVHGVSRSPTRPKWLSPQALTCRRKSRWNDKESDDCLS